MIFSKQNKYLQQIFKIYHDPLFRGFFFITNILLGISLEQGLLNKPILTHEVAFLIGNFFGLYIGIFLWKTPSHALKMGLKLWFLEGLLVALLLVYNTYWLFFLQGLVFGGLTLHIYLTAYEKSFKAISLFVSCGIIIGNIFLYCLKQLPNRNISILITALLLVGWRVKRPKYFDFNITDFASKSHFFFWSFLVIFYFLGGFYYSRIFSSLSVSRATFDIISFLPYSIAVAIGAFSSFKFFYFLPLFASLITGLSLIWQLTHHHLSFVPLSLLELGLGFADIFCMTYILSQTNSLLEAAFSFSLFPFAILISIYILHNYDSSFLEQYQWALTSILFAIIPTIFLIQRKQQRSVPQPLLALPANCKSDNTPNLTDSEKRECTISANEKFLFQIEPLITSREKEVLILLLQGYKLKDISSELDLALGTVKSICSRLYEKLEVKNKQELLRNYHFLLEHHDTDRPFRPQAKA